MTSEPTPAPDGPSSAPPPSAAGSRALKVVSWNLLRRVGAGAQEVARLIGEERPDLMLMQEATRDIDTLPELIGGFYARHPLPDRIHGLACWSPRPFGTAPHAVPLPPGALIRRLCQLVDLGPFTVANVHLSHGQVLNRRQLRHIASHLPQAAAVLGDYNLVGPVLLPGFRDVGPRQPTHRMVDMVPLRIDRCLVRGLVCGASKVLPHRSSDHHPISVWLAPDARAASRHPPPRASGLPASLRTFGERLRSPDRGQRARIPT